MNVPEIKDLDVGVGDREILKGVNLAIHRGTVHAIFGPNGSGKTTLVNVIMGFRGYEISGKIFFNGADITLSVNEQARLGIGMSFQRPPPIRGVKLRQLIENMAKMDGNLLKEYAERLHLSEFLEREVNLGFSGGEIKRAELLQLILQDPEFIFLDEPESGVDLENIALIGGYTNPLLGRKKLPSRKRR